MEPILLKPNWPGPFKRSVRGEKGKILKTITFVPGKPQWLDGDELAAVENDIGRALAYAAIGPNGDALGKAARVQAPGGLARHEAAQAEKAKAEKATLEKPAPTTAGAPAPEQATTPGAEPESESAEPSVADEAAAAEVADPPTPQPLNKQTSGGSKKRS